MAKTPPRLTQLFPQLDSSTPSSLSADTATEPAVISALIAAEERHPHDDRPWVYSNMVTSLDGGTAVEGVSGGLGGPSDKAVFAGLRDAADFIVVGASTVRSERYRPPNRSPEVQRSRIANDRPANPRLAVITASGNLPADLPLFEDPSNRPLVFTVSSADPESIAQLRERAEVVNAGDDAVDLNTVMTRLREFGGRRVLAEGGPRLNAQLIDAGLVDEWNLTLSPHLLAGNSSRAAFGELSEGPPAGMTLRRVWADDHFLFCRWVRA